jgi:deazaflavin-dependent oxidoreductase (nitroreductase family)
MPDQNENNRSIIEEFRANNGQVGGRYASGSMLILTTTGAKSGKQRLNPLACLKEGERLFIFASKAGSPRNPDWYHNLVANPKVTVEVGTETYEATAKPVTGPERDRIYARQAELRPVFDGYQKQTSRTIPVVELVRIG